MANITNTVKTRAGEYFNPERALPLFITPRSMLARVVVVISKTYDNVNKNRNFYVDLREESAKFINSLDFDCIAIGGVSTCEPKKDMYLAVRSAIPHITK